MWQSPPVQTKSPGSKSHCCAIICVNNEYCGTLKTMPNGTLVELARQPALGDVELKEGVAGGQCGTAGTHVILGTFPFVRENGGVPGADEMPARFRFCPDLIDELGYLIDFAPIGRFPGPPLRAIDGTQVSFFVGPGIPNVNIVVCEIFDVGVTGKEPEKFMDDSFEEDFSRRHQREALRQVKAQLRPKNALGPGPGPVAPGNAVIEDVLQKIEVLFHWDFYRQRNQTLRIGRAPHKGTRPAIARGRPGPLPRQTGQANLILSLRIVGVILF
jgi:hypothetical protein